MAKLSANIGNSTIKMRRGFILILVLAVLGVLTMLAIQLASQSASSKRLALYSAEKARALLLARSGVEAAVGRTIQESSNLSSGFSTSLAISVTPDATVGHALALIKDAAGAINVNDGIAAGKLELGNVYEADALDPASDHDISAYLNYRLRMLLNAYGDVHKLRDEAGLPDENDDSTTFGLAWTHSTGGGEGWGVASPASPIDSLGDRLIAARPNGGFTSLTAVRDLVNNWGTDNLSSAYLAGAEFFDLAVSDLTLHSVADNNFFRLLTPISKTHDQFQANAPDLSAPWQISPVSLINLNAATINVRAAVLHAPTDIRLLAYSARRHEHQYTSPMELSSHRHQQVMTRSPQLRTGGEYILGNYVQYDQGDNGVDQGPSSAKHLLSTRDSLILAQAWDTYTGSVEIIDSFPALRRFLSWKRNQLGGFFEKLAFPIGQTLEKSMRLDGNGRVINLGTTPDFGQRAPEYLLPHLLSGTRRMPGFLGAPAGLLSDYLQVGPLISSTSNNHYLYTGEDLVQKVHLPKVSFLGSGVIDIESHGITWNDSKRVIHTSIEVLKQTVIRSQNQFKAAMSSKDPDILIGPEWTDLGMSPHNIFGCVGLNDSAQPPSVGLITGCNLPFDGDLSMGPLGGSVQPFAPQDPATDPYLDPDIIIEGPPPGHASLPTSQSYFSNQGYSFVQIYQDMRTLPPPPGITWRRPLDSLTMLNSILFDGTVGGPIPAMLAALSAPDPVLPSGPLSAPQMRSYLNSLFVYLGQTALPPGATLDEYVWKMAEYLPNQIIYIKLLSNTWSNGIPKNITGQDGLLNSKLEIGDVSIFGAGATGCDISPFGGVLLSDRGHGFWSPGRFNDSLYWRPTSTFPSGQTPGQVFSKGFISFWYRVPHGHLTNKDKMILFDTTLWEQLELTSGATVTPSFRPVRLTCFLRPTVFEGGKNIHMTVWFQMIQTSTDNDGLIPKVKSFQLPQWAEDVGLPLIPFPANIPAFPVNPMGIPLTNNVNVPTAWPDLFKRDPIASHRYAIGGRFRPAGATTHDDALSTPGAWNRVVLGWDLDMLRDQLADRFWGAITTAPNSTFELVPNMKFIPPENSQMALSFGERHAHISSWTPGILTYKNEFIPSFPLNSLIDNIDMRFRSTGPITGQADISNLESTPWKTQRYLPGSTLTLKPPLPPGSQLIAVTTVVGDVPNLGSDDKRNAPELVTELHRSGALVNPLYTSEAHPFTSRQVRTWKPRPLTTSTELKFIWDTFDCNGNPVHPWCPDIPWLEEIQLLWAPPTSRTLSWEQD